LFSLIETQRTAVDMGLKPKPLAAYCKDLIPPVTGVGGNLAPVANTYDSSGNFVSRPRHGSVSKKRRMDEIDRVYDLSEPYPPLTVPARPSLDLKEVKSMLVAATAAGEDARSLLEEPDLDPKIKAFGCLSMALLNVVSSIVENGLVPLGGGGGGAGGGGPASPATVGVTKMGPPPPKTATGIKELKDSLEKADLESILFDADLGPVPVGNRNTLVAAFSEGIRSAAIKTAEEKGQDPSEAVRAMNDALECVSEMDFIGIKSNKQKDRPGSEPLTNKYCTMPIKLRFDDRNSRLHFERTVKAHCGLRAVMSLPRPLREEQALVSKALRDRYPGEMVSVRPDVGKLHFVAFRKNVAEKKWTRCSETVPIPPGVMLPNYRVGSSITLPPAVEISVPVPDQQMEVSSQDSSAENSS
jgi:hypothetical protein